MKARAQKPALDAAAAHLRALSLSMNAGAFVGSEDQLIEQLGVSRVTVRQAARLLEREGLLSVRRGANGGYFSARPDTHTIEGVLGGYLDTQRLDIEETFVVNFALWREAVQMAARYKNADVQATVHRLRKRLDSLPADAPIFEIVGFEDEYRRSIFTLARMPYVELMFLLNRNVTWRYIKQPPWTEGAVEPDFLRIWREVKQLELAAIEHGDDNAIIAAATRDRELWRERLFAQGIVAKRSL